MGPSCVGFAPITLVLTTCMPFMQLSFGNSAREPTKDESDTIVHQSRDLKASSEYMEQLKKVQNVFLMEGAARLLIVCILILSVLLLHYSLLKLWGYVPFLVHRPLPRLFVFPRVELLVGVQAVLGASESAGLLLASKSVSGICLGVLTVCLVGAFTGKFAGNLVLLTFFELVQLNEF